MSVRIYVDPSVQYVAGRTECMSKYVDRAFWSTWIRTSIPRLEYVEPSLEYVVWSRSTRVCGMSIRVWSMSIPKYVNSSD